MPAAEMNRIIRHIRRMAEAPDGGVFTDGQLLQQFLARRDETAFEAPYPVRFVRNVDLRLLRMLRPGSPDSWSR